MERLIDSLLPVYLIILLSVCHTYKSDEVDPPYCEAKGNVYTPYPGTYCRYFDQRAGQGPVPFNTLRKLHPCPLFTRFDTKKCVCNYDASVRCNEQEVPVRCSSNGNMFTLMPGSGCKKYDHRASDTAVPDQDVEPTQTCPDSTRFNTVACTCDYNEDTVCDI